jgi:trimethylamine--corrinoid protein Co-methyltransferase
MALFKKNVDLQVVEKIHKTAMDVFEKKGVYFGSERVRDIFREHGMRVEGEIVYLTENEVMAALRQVPAKFTLRGREPQYDVEIGGGLPVCCPAYGPVFTSRYEQRRQGTKEDLINFVKLLQTSGTIQVLNPHVLVPNDVPATDIGRYQQGACLRYGSKPTMGITDGYAESKAAIRAVKAANARSEDDYL